MTPKPPPSPPPRWYVNPASGRAVRLDRPKQEAQ